MFCFFIYENVKKLLSEIFPEIFPYIFRLIYQIQLWERRLVYSKVDILSKLKRGHTKFITYSVAVENKFTIFLPNQTGYHNNLNLKVDLLYETDKLIEKKLFELRKKIKK